ncbi:MAG: HAD family hydrolase [Flavobacteriaceae bacterium]
MNNSIEVIAFDADDTLWVNETYFREAEEEFGKLLAPYETPNQVQQELFKTEIHNLGIYGYGIKGFMLSMVEAGLKLSNGQISSEDLKRILGIGKEMLNKPVELLPGVREVLQELSKNYKLILVTKGDLLDQERKLEKSGLSGFFHHVEILSDKKESDYEKLVKRLELPKSSLMMVGNSLKSDVLPLVDIGVKAVHIPFHTTWAHEEAEPRHNNSYVQLNQISELIDLLK